MSADSAVSAAGSSRTVPTIVMILGGLILAYGLIILAPIVPTAAWSGVVDSASAGAAAGPQFPGRKTSRALTLYLRGAPSGRSFALPEGNPVSADLFHPGDTVRASVGWGTLRPMALVVQLTNSSTTLVDSALVLRQQRTQRGRTALAGAAVLLLGVAGMTRSARRK